MALPRYDELPLRGGWPASWGVWGEVGTDVFGCLNLLTEERQLVAARTVQRGAIFSLNWDMRLPSPPLFFRQPFEHEVMGGAIGGSTHDEVLHGWNTQSCTQWDGFRHMRNHSCLAEEPGTGHYGGVPDARHGVHHWAQRGIVGRGVLVDVARWREANGNPLQHDRADVIEPGELAECLAAQGTTLLEGDVLLLRTGWVQWYEQLPPDARGELATDLQFAAPGLRGCAELAEVLWNLHIAAIAADNPTVELWPPGAWTTAEHNAEVRAERSRYPEIFAHSSLLPLLGLPLGEMWALDALADDCADDGRYEFLLVSAPMNLAGGVATPANAVAIK